MRGATIAIASPIHLLHRVLVLVSLLFRLPVVESPPGVRVTVERPPAAVFLGRFHLPSPDDDEPRASRGGLLLPREDALPLAFRQALGHPKLAGLQHHDAPFPPAVRVHVARHGLVLEEVLRLVVDFPREIVGAVCQVLLVGRLLVRAAAVLVSVDGVLVHVGELPLLVREDGVDQYAPVVVIEPSGLKVDAPEGFPRLAGVSVPDTRQLPGFVGRRGALVVERSHFSPHKVRNTLVRVDRDGIDITWRRL